MADAARAYWKRFAESATVFARRYEHDPFRRTEVRIALLEIGYALILLALAVIGLVVLYHDVVGGMVAALSTALTSTTTPLTPESITAPLVAARTREIIGMSILFTLTAGLFGYLVSRVALLPTRQALAAQKQFIGNVAHELRTPLSIIKTNTEIRLLDSNVPPAIFKILQENLEELDRISDIINNLLSVNALVQPERLRFSRVDLGTIVRFSVNRLTPLAHRKPVRFHARVTRGRFVHGNRAALEQIVMNLVKNAIQHTERGEVVASVRDASGGYVELSVRDTGTGIAPDDLKRIFEPFFRGDRARSRTGGGGSGLGLAIVSELVKLHHGRINIKSARGRGTNVVVLLPADRDLHVPPAPQPSTDETSVDFTRTRNTHA